MKYKVGDKVKIKTWDDMEKEYGLDNSNDIPCGSGYFFPIMDQNLENFCHNRILNITEITDEGRYRTQEFQWSFIDEMIEHKIIEEKYSRFELLDL